jgi:hypothetical protein
VIALLQLRLSPSPANKATGATHFEAPTGDLAGFILFVDVQPRARMPKSDGEVC